MRKHTFFVLVALMLGLAACGGGGQASPTTSAAGGADVAQGKTVFDQVASPPCSSCHSIEPGVTLVGPSLAGIGTSAATIEPGKSAEAFLRESIVDPNAYVPDGFAANVMPSNYGSQLSKQQIDDLVAYLMSLK
jgi:nitric oxide reductase subunit C